MAVLKFTLTEENYNLAVVFMDEINNTRTISRDQLVRLHALSTKLGVPSSPGGCSSCNRKALDIVKAYIYQYENREE